MCELDVFAANFTLVDWDIHKLWLDGFSANEAVTFLNLDLQKEFPEFSHDLLVSDVNDNYRLFSMMETVILNYSNPAALGSGGGGGGSSGGGGGKDCLLSQFQFVDVKSRARLVESYYSLDSELCREIVGKKLSSRLRKDLDEICDKPSCKSKVKLRSARRQYDNVKRIFKTIEEMAGDYVTNIRHQFGLSRELAQKYATLVFASSFRFEVSKKRLNYLTFENIMNISLILIGDWIDYGGGGGGGATGSGKNAPPVTAADDGEDLFEPTLDKDFLTSLRDLKTLQDRDKEHRNVVCCRLRSSGNSLATPAGPKRDSSSSTLGSIDSTSLAAAAGSSCQLSSARAYQELESGFRSLSRGLVSVAVGLSHNKEVKDFFVHLVEKVVEPLRSMTSVTREDANLFLVEYTASITEAASVDSSAAGGPTMMVDNEVRAIFTRFMKTLHPAILSAMPD